MKKLLILVSFVFLSGLSYSQWVSQNVSGNLYFLNGIDFFNSQTGAIGGWYGGFSSTIGRALYTSNGGANWIPSIIPDSLRVLLEIQYIDQQNVYGFGVKNITFNSDNRVQKLRPEFKEGSLNERTDGCLNRGSNETRGYFLKSTNSGVSWQYYSAMPPEVTYLYTGKFTNSSTGFASAVSYLNTYNKSGIIRTTNGGLNWSFVSPADSFQNYRRMEFPNSTTGFAIGEHLDTNAAIPFQGLILRTINGGSNWSRTKIPEINNFKGVSFANSTTGFAIGTTNSFPYGAYFYKTTNAGSSWFKLPFREDTSFADGINFVAGTGRGFAFGPKFEEDPQNPGNFIQIGYFIDRTTDYGQTWHKTLLNDPEGVLINSDDIDQNTWFICGGNIFTERGIVLKTTNGGGPIGIIQISSEVPGKFSLHQNYPNPFNPSTKIKFGLPKSGQISFKVFDILGRLVYRIEEFKQYGTYEITFENSGLSSGIYYYKLESGSQTQTKKMILLK